MPIFITQFKRVRRLLCAASGLVLIAACQTTTIQSSATQPNTIGQPVFDESAADTELPSNIKSQAPESFSVADYDNLWDRVRDGFEFQQPLNARTQHELKTYTKHPAYIAKVAKRSEPFLHYIVNEAEKRNIPTELALLPVVESAFDPFAYSHGRASGIWQFVPATGKYYGLKQNWWYDGRRDVVAATDAALNYLSSLNKRFDGDWLLTLAAYNAGGGTVSRAIKRNKAAGKPTDYWSLDLPKETKSYVPRLLAIVEITRHPEKYDIELARIPNEPYFDIVDTSSQIDLAQASNLAQISMEELYKLNAGFNRWATDPKGPHRLAIPADKADDFRNALAALPDDSRTGWEIYKIKQGDSLSVIASKFNTNVSAIKDINNMRHDRIRQGQTLMIPIASKSAQHYAYSETQRVKRKQTKSKGTSGTIKTLYKVKSGDSLWSIARAFDVKVSKLAKWNAIVPKDPIRSGQSLVVWAESAQIAKNPQAKRDPVMRKVAYKVRNGDSLARIAHRFNLSVSDIVSWNPIKKNGYIHPGQPLTLFVDVTKGLR